MVAETVIQLKKLHAIEDMEQAIFALERGIPVPPRVVETLKTLFQVMVADYNNAIAEAEEMERQIAAGVGSAAKEGATSDITDDNEPSE